MNDNRIKVIVLSEGRNAELGSFLKTRRARIQPSEVGLPSGTRRRTPGLRREELAQIAGVGLTWYTWLEQGRDIQVSDQILESLAKALQLSREETRHLFALADRGVTYAAEFEHSPVSRALRNLMDNIAHIPVYVMDHRWNVLAWNDIAQKVFGDFGSLPEAERNIARLMFTNRPYMDLFDDWTFHAQGIVARFRATCGKYPDDAQLGEFVQNLCRDSAIFNDWWALHDVHGMNDVVKEITHPVVGKMVFEFVSLDASVAPGVKLIFHNPTVDTDTKEKIALLQSSTTEAGRVV